MASLKQVRSDWTKSKKKISDVIDGIGKKELEALIGGDEALADELRGYKKQARHSLRNLNDSFTRKVLTTANANAITGRLNTSSARLNGAMIKLKKAGDGLDAAAKALGAIAAIVGAVAAL